MDANSEEQFKSEIEFKFWAEIYKGSCGGESGYTDDNPAADAADIAVQALRERFQWFAEHAPPPEGDAPGKPKEKQEDFLGGDSKDGPEPTGPGGHTNSPK